MEEQFPDPWGRHVDLYLITRLPWRTGTKARVTVYARNAETGFERPFLMAPTPEIAQHIVDVHNAFLEDGGSGVHA